MKWTNWSGSLTFTPSEVYEPFTEEELSQLVQQVANRHHKIRLVGAGHSSSPLVFTRDYMVSLKNFLTVDRVDKNSSTAWIGAGLTVKQAGTKLLDYGLSFHNTGDVDMQTVAGAISTGTHGSGITLQNLSSMLIGCRIITADGSIREYTEEEHGKDFFDALRLSLGTFGLMTSLRLKLQPAFKLIRREYCTHADTALEHLDELIHENRCFDFYWYPRSDMIKLRTANEPGQGHEKLDYAYLKEEMEGWAVEVLPKDRQLKFDEMEYALPAEEGPKCFDQIRKMVKQTFRKTIAWRVLYRTVKADDYFISPFYGRDSVTISLHHNAGLPFMDYFRAIEPIFLKHGGRPHWGKKHTLKNEQIKPLFPRWDDFLAIRKQMDPQEIFLNDHLKTQIFSI
jgi:FAD/FMN-containing dehydrogenase